MKDKAWKEKDQLHSYRSKAESENSWCSEELIPNKTQKIQIRDGSNDSDYAQNFLQERKSEQINSNRNNKRISETDQLSLPVLVEGKDPAEIKKGIDFCRQKIKELEQQLKIVMQ